MMALKQHLSNGCEGDDILISNDHFETALSRVHPSVSEKDLKEYDYICKSLR
jgi:SpoVK/Ycf46/Vps4 family AAA+-type ATPase